MHQALTKRFDFPIIPYTDPVAISAGYTSTDVAQVYSGPVLDEDKIYYCVYSGSIFFNTFKNGLLVCLRKSDASVVYVKNVQDYNLDTGDTMIGVSRMVVRAKLVICGDRLYMTSGWITNIGPQLFCVDKRTGAKIYSIAYDLPKTVKAVYGADFLTTTGDYSAFKGSNARVGDLFPTVKNNKIYVGTSSLQNFLNPGLIPTSNNYTGYPFWTDRGALTIVREFFNSAVVEARTYTCAPEFEPGQVLSLTDPEHNPFTPGECTVLIATITTGPITSPGAINGVYYFAQRIDSTLAPVTAANVAPFWALVGSEITLTNAAGVSTTNLDLTAALTAINAVPGRYVLSIALDDPSAVVGTTGSGDFAVWYIKKLHAGEEVDNIYDANGLGYYGFSVWGSEPHLECDYIVFGSGQAHSIPVSERLIFRDPSKNYRELKKPLVDLSVEYASNPNPSTLHLLEKEKKAFNKRIRELVILELRSPRGQRSYVDAIFGSDADNGELLFAVRSVPNDVFTFLGVQDPVTISALAQQDIDGDAASSVWKNGEQLSAATKNGGLLTIDLTHWRRGCCKWDHSSPTANGVNVEPIVYTGPNATLGGTVYVSTAREDKCDNLHLLALSSNISSLANGGSSGTIPSDFEKFVSSPRTGGKFFPTGYSFAYSYDQDGREVEWNTRLEGTAFGNVATTGKLLLCNDNSGHLYAIETEKGNIVQTIDSGSAPHPMRGGIASPAIDKDGRVYWLASYDAPGQPPTAGQYGWVLKLNKKWLC